ncbi:FG-GAP-like repeat-containing protein [Streptomyces sp. 3N207]|uniref:FG-GAP-like repeat-containing protein n=1 Tax=Streptomyces sp. 3N207 TaxID=3457417 RepID=UPI003FD68EB2
MRQKANTGRGRSATAALTVNRIVGTTVVVAGVALAGALYAGASPADHDAAPAKAAAPTADFDADGRADVVATAPEGSVGNKSAAGYITVVHGSDSGADTGHRQVINRDSANIPGDATASQRWGDRTAARDLDGDGASDLVVGSPDSTTGLTVVWGAKGKGLTEGVTLPKDKADSHAFGAGDFNGDGNADLVTGAGGDEMRMLYGPFTREGTPASTDEFTSGEDFGPDRIITGDVTGDGVDDVVTTHSMEESSHSSRFWKGTKDGLSTKPVEIDDAVDGTVGDVDNDGHGDLVIRTVPDGSVENLPNDHGTVKVLYGTESGPSTSRTTTLSQDSADVPGTNEDGDELGASLSAGDVNGDGYADIAAGVPGEDVGTDAAGKDTGAIIQFYGAEGGLGGTGAKNYDQSTAGIPGATEGEDRFGSAVSLQDADGDGHDDLAIGAPGEDGTEEEPEAGAVWALPGTGDGLSTEGVVSYGPTTLGAPASNAGLGTSFPH